MVEAGPGRGIVTILLGLVGAVVGGFITQSILGLGNGGFIWTVIAATLGAVILLAIYRAVAGRRRASLQVLLPGSLPFCKRVELAKG